MGKAVAIACLMLLNCGTLAFGLQFSDTDVVGLNADQEFDSPALVASHSKRCEPYDETLGAGDQYAGKSLQLGDAPSNTPVVWTTGTDGRYDALVTMEYTDKSKEYVVDDENPNGSIKFNSGKTYVLNFGYDKAEIGGCALKHVRIGEVDGTKGNANILGLTRGGLAPIPGKPTHPYLEGRPPRMSFCFESASGKDGKLIWGAAEAPEDEAHTRLKVIGGMKAHHWAVNVTGFAVSGVDGDSTAWVPLADEVREENADNKSAYWLALFDTSSTLLSVPKEVLEELQKHLDERNVLDCESASQLPRIMIKLGDDGEQFVIPPESYIGDAGSTLTQKYHRCASCSSSLGGRRSFDVPLHFAPKYKVGEAIPAGKCALMLAPPSPFPGVFALGIPFLKAYTTTFDFERREIVTAKSLCDSMAAPSEGLSGAARVAPAAALALSFVAALAPAA